MNTDAEKAALRDIARATRARIHVQKRDRAAAIIAEIGLDFIKPGLLERGIGVNVSGYAAMTGELDAGPLLARLHGDSVALSLPVTMETAQPLVFRSWQPGDEMAPGFMGIKEPLATAPQVNPDVVLLPLLAFDDHGFRLGYGGGHFDRSLQALRKLKPVIAVGLAYDEQRVDAVPHDRYDQQLDWILTPSGARRFAGD